MMLGAHVSAAGGLHNSIRNGEKLECEAIQIFLRNPNRWVGKEPATNRTLGNFERRGLRLRLFARGLSTTSTYPISPLPSRRFLRNLATCFFPKWSSQMPAGFDIL